MEYDLLRGPLGQGRRGQLSIVRWAVAAVTMTTLVACAGPRPPITPDDSVFAGLDSVVVSEVLDSPIAAERVDGDDAAAAAARYQGMVRNFTACRSALKAYEEWMNSGIAPTLEPQPVPSSPSMWARDMDDEIEGIERDLRSGDITLLRDRLTMSSGCGNWIPATPGDVSGPTIADVVNGKS